MNKLSKHMTPALRFHGYTEPWEKILLGNFLSFKNGINADKDSYGSGYKFINVLDIINNNFIKHDSIIGKVNVGENTFNKNDVIYGDILFQRSSETRIDAGQSNVYLDKDKKSTFGGFVIRGRGLKKYNPIFMNYLLKTWLARRDIIRKCGGSTRYNVGQDTLSEVELYITNCEKEQEEIGNIIFTMDKKISLLKKKLDLLNKYKNGVMQKISKQNVSFKDETGRNFSDWQEYRLGELLQEFSLKSTTENEYLVLSSTIKGMELRSGRVDGKSNIGYKIIKKNQIVFSPQNLWLGNINVNKDFDIGIVSPSYKTFNFDESILDVEYGSYLLKTARLIHEYGVSSETGASVVRRNLNKELFNNIKIKIPSIKEQRKISEFLRTVNLNINGVIENIDISNKLKNSLIQKLFV